MARLAVVALAAFVSLPHPTGTPDLAAMALRVSDLPAGSKILRQGYGVSGGAPSYSRSFVPDSVRLVGSRLDSLANGLVLRASASDAAALVDGVRADLRTPAGRARVAQTFSAGFGPASGAPPSEARMSMVDLRLGDDSTGFVIAFTADRIRFRVVYVFVQVDRVVSDVVAVTADSRLRIADVARLAGPLVTRIRAGLVPVATSPPTIDGSAELGATLTATTGAWTNAPTAYRYQWQRCDGAACAPIAGAAGPTYVATADDLGATLRVSVVASNSDAAGAPAVSAPTPSVVL